MSSLFGFEKASISIHAPREGCDSPQLRSEFGEMLFQSTHPVRGATCGWWCRRWCRSYFNPRTP